MSTHAGCAESTQQDVVGRAKQNALRLALQHANAEVVEFKALALVDLQGIYLRLHEVLTGINFPIESGAIIGRLGALQINDVFVEIQQALKQKLGNRVGILQEVYDEIEVELVEGKAYLAQAPRVIEDGKYLHVETAFEVFYATPPLAELKWPLGQEERKGSLQAREQLRLLKAGKIRHPNFERDYRFFSEFVDAVKANPRCRGYAEGFFSWRVGPKGLQYLDEKCVDTSIVIRSMEALYEKHADVLCIISSDQDFIPVKEKCEKFDVEFFQKDAAKFFSGTYVGKEIASLGDNYIAGTFKPEWPIEILTEHLRPGSDRGYLLDGITEKEALALASFHNAINEYKVNLAQRHDGSFQIILTRPDGTDVEYRNDPKTNMRQVKITTLEY